MPEPESNSKFRILRAFKFEHAGVAFAIFAASLGALMYFTGVQFVDERARTLGLSGHLGDPPFQQLVATGFGVFFTSNYIFALMAAVLSLLFGCLIAVEDRRRTKSAAKQSSLENSLPLGIRFLWRWFVKLSKKFLVELTIIVFAVVLPPAIVLFTGGLAGREDAKAIVEQVSGSCSSCWSYRSKSRRVLGVPAFQTEDNLIVATKTGLVTFDLTGPLVVEWPRDYPAALDKETPIQFLSGASDVITRDRSN